MKIKWLTARALFMSTSAPKAFPICKLTMALPSNARWCPYGKHEKWRKWRNSICKLETCYQKNISETQETQTFQTTISVLSVNKTEQWKIFHPAYKAFYSTTTKLSTSTNYK